MLRFFKTSDKGLIEIPEVQDGCWICATAPNEAEIYKLESEIGIDRTFIRSALDEEETSRIEIEEKQTLIVVDYPVAEKNTENTILYYTLPMGIILTEKNVITVCLKENVVLDEISSGMVRGATTHLKTRFVFFLLLRIAARYLQFLKQIDKISNHIENQLHKSMKNKELIQLLGLEKSLVYFSTSLKANESILEKILRGRVIKLYDDDQDLLEDVLIEIKQAIEMCNIYSSILSGTMDAFASVISNNLNIVMKTLTIITIVMAIPNIVFSFYGMNVIDMPNAVNTVVIAVSITVVLCIIASLFLLKSKFMK